MSEEKVPSLRAIEAHEEFVQHIESGAGRMVNLALATIIVSGLLAGSYISQLVVVPFLMNMRVQTVDLLDPWLVATELVILGLTLVWMYTGLREFLFARKMIRQVKEIRELESQAAAKHGLSADRGEGSATG